MTQEWYYIRDDQQIGPVGQQQMVEGLDSGLIAPGTQVWTEGLADWTPAGQLDQLRQASRVLASAPPPAPSSVAYPALACAAPRDNAPGAVASMVLGILALASLSACAPLCIILGPLAVRYGYRARRSVRNSPDAYAGRGMAIAGLIMGWIATAIGIAGLIALAVFIAVEHL